MTYDLHVNTFQMGTPKEAAVKVLEGGAESFAAWQRLEGCRALSFESCMDAIRMTESDYAMRRLADELADCVQACCNLADRCGIELAAAMGRCEQRNRERGRYE